MLDSAFGEEIRLWQALSAYLPPNLIKMVVRNKAAFQTGRWQTQPGSLLFADINGFTAMWNKLGQNRSNGSEELTNLLNHYFADMLEVVQRYGGVPLKFGGDSLLALFRGNHHPLWAVASAAEMQRVADSYRIVHTSQGSFNLSMSIGVHSGPIQSALLGDTSKRLEYLVSGSSLHRTLAAETLSVKGEVLVTPPLYQYLQNFPDFKFEEIERESKLFYRLQDAATLPAKSFYGYSWPNLTKIQSTLDLLGRFVPDLVRKRIEINLKQQRTQLESEHRQVTCFFLGVLNPENERDYSRHLQALNQLFLLLTNLAEQYRGSIARLDANAQGERFLLLFGAPIANEDDATRALLCALRLFQEKALLRNKLRCHIGITTGPVFSTEVGSYWRKEYTIMGSSINLAARLTAKAPPDQIWLDTATYEAADKSLLKKVSTQKLDFKGFAEPVSVYVLEAQSEISALSTAIPSVVPTLVSNLPLIGRVAEMQKFYRRLGAIKHTSTGAILLVHAPAGYGKTRLLSWFVQNWNNYRWNTAFSGTGLTLRAECSGYYSQVPYRPWLMLLERLYSLQPNTALDLPQTQRLLSLVAQFAPLAYHRDGWTLKGLLGEGETSAAQDKGDIFKRSFFRLWEELLNNLITYYGPLLLVIDNIHACDQLSLELFNALGKLTQTLPLVLCASGRTSDGDNDAETKQVDTTLNFGWLDKLAGSGVTTEHFKLSAFKLAEVQLQVKQLLDTVYVPPALLQTLMQQTKGNPFYIEELVQMLRRAGQLTVNPRTKRSQWRQSTTTDEFSTTTSLKNLIISSLDSLPSFERELLQIGAVIGPEFELSLLAQLVSVAQSDPELNAELAQLCRKGWLVALDYSAENKADNPKRFQFRQQLVQQIIYDGLAFMRRRQLHRKIAQFLEETAPDESLENLAFHYGRSDVGQAAFNYLSRAGHKVFANFAYKAALTYHEMALDWLKRLQLDYQPPILLQIYRECGQSARMAGQYKNAIYYYQQMLILAQEQNDLTAQVSALNGTAAVKRQMGEFDFALEYAQQSLELAKQCDKPELLAETYDLLGGILFFQQDLQAALVQFQYASTLNQQWMANLEPGSKGLEVSQQLLAQCLGNIGLINVFTGKPSAAQQHFQRAFEIASELNLKYLMLTLSINLGELSQLYLAAEKAQSYHQLALAISRESGVHDLECEALRNLGMDYLLKSEFDRAEACLWESLDLADFSGSVQMRTQIIENLAEVTLAAGKLEQAADLLEQLQEVEQVSLTPGLQKLQARLLNLRRQPSLAIQIMLHLLKEIEQQPNQEHQLWQLYYELAQLYSQRREWSPYANYVRRAFEQMQIVTVSLQGCELAVSFQNAPIVQRLSQEYHFIVQQEVSWHEATSA